MVRVCLKFGPLSARACADGSDGFGEKPGLETEGRRRGLEGIDIALSASALAQTSTRVQCNST